MDNKGLTAEEIEESLKPKPNPNCSICYGSGEWEHPHNGSLVKCNCDRYLHVGTAK